MSDEAKQPATLRTSGPASAKVLEHVASRKRRTVRLPEDEAWLREITPHSKKLLSRMKQRGLLYRIGPGKYVVAPPGSSMKEQAASEELLTDAILGSYGPYYIGYLSAMIGHRLTDLHSETVFVAMPELAKPRRTPEGFRIAGKSPARWPVKGSKEIERVRAVEGAKEFVCRSSIARTLVDGLLRPDLCAGIETVVSVWQAAWDSDVSWDAVAELGKHSGPATSRRVLYLLGLMGMTDIAEKHLSDIEGRTGNVLFDRSNGFRMDRTQMKRDARSGVIQNVPLEYLYGWVGVKRDQLSR